MATQNNTSGTMVILEALGQAIRAWLDETECGCIELASVMTPHPGFKQILKIWLNVAAPVKKGHLRLEFDISIEKGRLHLSASAQIRPPGGALKV